MRKIFTEDDMIGFLGVGMMEGYAAGELQHNNYIGAAIYGAAGLVLLGSGLYVLHKQGRFNHKDEGNSSALPEPHRPIK